MEFLFPLLILLLFIPIFLSGRRQKRQMQQMQQMQAALEPGDVIVTTSGLRGTIVDASYEDTIDIEIADGIVTTWVRGAVREKVVEQATAEEAPVEEPTTETAAIEDEPATPSLEKTAPEKKDESTNGTARS
ncbi:preprotein translocase subunit YajC [Pseudonocardia cypriaca]|uniref:Preprotein translocase subunit YajC n=1 Tax=Pseudonocardia cypriaca TaxID=882449 RepID=A0A543GGM2_9PSEU|nr:preprotein translocase subunit YajC [Pseudonocardia cypriaca]TQM45228.1 preprotein translocase subunit YajC [Pseudonocardia cypriaca]